jgi:hypothetical protein
MLYRCYCKPFSSHKNKLREKVVEIASRSINKQFNINKSLKGNVLFIEPGGLLDEYFIIKNIDIKNKNLSIFLYETTKNIAIEKAQNTFYKRLIKINKNIDFRIYDDSFLEIIDKINTNVDSLWIICIDPILQLYIPSFEKNILENMESQKIIKDKFKFSHQIYLFLEENVAKIEEISLQKT